VPRDGLDTPALLLMPPPLLLDEVVAVAGAPRAVSKGRGGAAAEGWGAGVGVGVGIGGLVEEEADAEGGLGGGTEEATGLRSRSRRPPAASLLDAPLSADLASDAAAEGGLRELSTYAEAEEPVESLSSPSSASSCSPPAPPSDILPPRRLASRAARSPTGPLWFSLDTEK
jgi:hypothetical protein